MRDWRPVPGYEGLYIVSSGGEVQSLPRKGTKGGLLNRHPDAKGYMAVGLSKDNKVRFCKVHRIVAEAFLENPCNFPQVNHRDGNKRNNEVSNLEWCSAKMNMLHSVQTGLRTDLKPVDMFSLDGKLVATYSSCIEAERQTGAHNGHISACCKGKYGFKTAGGYIWKYHNTEDLK